MFVLPVVHLFLPVSFRTRIWNCSSVPTHVVSVLKFHNGRPRSRKSFSNLKTKCVVRIRHGEKEKNRWVGGES